MKQYSDKISISLNERGVYSIDTSIGCTSGMSLNKRGCYGDCYAAKSAKMFGYDFSKTIYRKFESTHHKIDIINQINSLKIPFIRIGTSGDPSENWEHTINILKVICRANTDVVIITKHWTNLSNKQLEMIKKLNVCINTSVSALDDIHKLSNSLIQYKVLKKYCKSILRIVSADFNKENNLGVFYDKIQNKLFQNEDIIDTVLRLHKNNFLIKHNIVNVKEMKFLGNKRLVSKFNKKTYLGDCHNCIELCGVNVGNKIIKPNNQLSLI